MSSAKYMCRDFVEDVTAYLEGALSEGRVKIIEAHLAICPHCVEYLREIRLSITATGALADSDLERMPDDVRARLLHAFEHKDN